MAPPHDEIDPRSPSGPNTTATVATRKVSSGRLTERTPSNASTRTYSSDSRPSNPATPLSPSPLLTRKSPTGSAAQINFQVLNDPAVIRATQRLYEKSIDASALSDLLSGEMLRKYKIVSGRVNTLSILEAIITRYYCCQDLLKQELQSLIKDLLTTLNQTQIDAMMTTLFHPTQKAETRRRLVALVDKQQDRQKRALQLSLLINIDFHNDIEARLRQLYIEKDSLDSDIDNQNRFIATAIGDDKISVERNDLELLMDCERYLGKWDVLAKNKLPAAQRRFQEISSLQREKDELKAQIALLENQLNNRQFIFTSTQDTIDSLRKTIARLESENKSLQVAVVDAEITVSSAHQDAAVKVQKDIRRLEALLDEEKAKVLRNFGKYLDYMNASRAKNDAQAEELKAQKETLLAAESRCKALELELVKVRAEITAAVEAHSSLQKSEFDAKLAEMASQAKQQAARLELALQEKETAATESAKQVEALVNENAQHAETIATLAQSNNHLSSQLNDVVQTNTQLQESVEELLAKDHYLTQALEKAKQQEQEHIRQNATLQRELIGQRENNSLKAAVAELDQWNELISETEQRLQEKYAQLKLKQSKRAKVVFCVKHDTDDLVFHHDRDLHIPISKEIKGPARFQALTDRIKLIDAALLKENKVAEKVDYLLDYLSTTHISHAIKESASKVQEQSHSSWTFFWSLFSWKPKNYLDTVLVQTALEKVQNQEQAKTVCLLYRKEASDKKQTQVVQELDRKLGAIKTDIDALTLPTQYKNLKEYTKFLDEQQRIKSVAAVRR